MQFLKSLFCLQGLDSRARFFAICSATYVIFIMLISAFADNAFISLAILALFTPILALTSLRRLQDAKLNKKLFAIPTILFALTTFIIIFSEQNSSYYLLLISVLCLAVLLTYPSIRTNNSARQNYILGYCGPVDMSEYQQASNKGKQATLRIEPSLVGDNIVNLNNEEQSILHNHQTTSDSENKQGIDLGEMVRLKLMNNRKAQVIIIGVLTLVLVGIAISWSMGTSKSESSQTTQPSKEIAEKKQDSLKRTHPLAMPDNFTLFLSQYQGVIINWQADEVDSPLLWSQSNAQGDKSCQQISFNKGNPIRSLTVTVEKSITDSSGIYNNYFASFSPLDSKALIQALAFRGNFTLCGYNFSLKGSQAALGQNKNYASWVEY